MTLRVFTPAGGTVPEAGEIGEHAGAELPPMPATVALSCCEPSSRGAGEDQRRGGDQAILWSLLAMAMGTSPLAFL